MPSHHANALPPALHRVPSSIPNARELLNAVMSSLFARNIIVEVYRETFPRHLRFDKPCQILHAQLSAVSRRYKHKKYIPKTELEAVLNSYAQVPGRPWTQLPVLRQVLLVRIVNAVRVFRGAPTWLYTRGVECEHKRIEEWLEKQKKPVAATQAGARKRAAYANNPAAAAAVSRQANMVEREKFEREALGSFHVATMYHRMIRAGVGMVLLLLALMFASVNTDYIVYLYLYYWKHMNHAAVMEWMREVTRQHTTAEVPDAYKSLLPPPCVSYTAANGEVTYGVNMTELVLPDRGITVVCIPCPQVGTKDFYERVGELAALCDAVVMEGVRFDMADRISPAALLPLKDNTFPALGVHHRFLDILRLNSEEPPMLFPGGADVGWWPWLQYILIPFEVRCVYKPTETSATKGEARVAWGRLREIIEEREATAAAAMAAGGSYMIAVPWTVNQVVNIEASLCKMGFKVKSVFPLSWLEEDHMGRCFCDFYNIKGASP